MFDPLTLALIGGGVGLLTNKKRPIEGALLGAGLGYGGGLLAPAASGAAQAAPSAYTGTIPELAADGLGGIAPETSALDSAKELAKNAKPFMDAAGPAMQVAGIFNRPEAPQVQSSPVMQNQPASPAFQGLLSNIDEQARQRQQQEQARRELRRKLIGGMR